MRTATILAAVSLAATAYAQAVPEGIAPSTSAPDGCEENSKSNFTIGYTELSKKRDTAIQEAALECILEDGILKDPYGRVGSVVANRQFQFDGPPQAGAIYTGGFSVCKNTSLAIGGSTRWWKCGSGGFFNLYDENIGEQCDEIRIVVTYGDDAVSSSSSVRMSSTTSSSASAASGSASSSASLSVTPLSSINGTQTTSAFSSFGSAPATTTSNADSTTGSSQAPDAPPQSTGGAALPTRLPKRETFGAVVGILGAALIL